MGKDDTESRRRLIAVARGDEAPDVVIDGARVFGAFTREWLEGDVAIAEGRFAGVGHYPGGKRIDGRERFLVPGFIDAHVHLESSQLMVDELARVLVARGTTAVVCDPHEIANVLGVEGVEWLLDACAELPLDVFAMAPSCVPASPFESPRAALGPAELARIVARADVLGIAEMMNFPAVVAGDGAELEKLALASRADGHAPGLAGAALNAYLAAGVRTDHEAISLEEALERRRKGMWVLIREASGARNLRDLLPLVVQHGPERCAFCTDDREAGVLLREGHIDQMCRVAVEEGVSPEDALLLATLHPALCHGLEDRGAIAPGWRADCVLLDDLRSFRATLVVKDGRVAARDGRTGPVASVAVPDWVRDSIRCRPVGADDLAIAAPAVRGTLPRPDIRVIGIVPDQIVTRAQTVPASVRDGLAVADPERDLAKIVVVERHHASGRIGRGFVTGFGPARGALASTVAHDAHNLVAIGIDDRDIAACIARLCELGGGLALACDGDVVGELPLPVAGLLSDRPAEEVAAAVDALNEHARELGVRVSAPFLTLSFLALSVIGELKITDRGLVDVERFELVDLTIGG
jgi:adenine deaminase